jgi:hypothetical protein
MRNTHEGEPRTSSLPSSPCSRSPLITCSFLYSGVNRRDSNRCSYCYKAALHHNSLTHYFLVIAFVLVAIVVPLSTMRVFSY